MTMTAVDRIGSTFNRKNEVGNFLLRTVTNVSQKWCNALNYSVKQGGRGSPNKQENLGDALFS